MLRSKEKKDFLTIERSNRGPYKDIGRLASEECRDTSSIIARRGIKRSTEPICYEVVQRKRLTLEADLQYVYCQDYTILTWTEY